MWRKVISRLLMSLPAGLAGLLVLVAGLCAQDDLREDGAIVARQVTRGPLHEAYASPLPQHGPRRTVNHIPPATAEEPIPVFRPQGNPVWIPGYWFWDDESQCFVWVGGVWRIAPEGRQWVPGFWKVKNGGSIWYPGFWAQPQVEDRVLAPPPPPRDPVVPTLPPEKDRVAFPGHWNWNGFQYLWQPGTWSRIGPGFVWIPPHNVPLPGGSRLVTGYWDYSFATRGLASCPSRVPPVMLKGKQTPRVIIEPIWFLRPETIQPHLFVQNQSGHYLFGDYYSPLMHRLGIQHWFDSSRLTLDPLFSLERALHREDKSWEVQVYKYVLERQMGQVPRPPREIVMSDTGEIPLTSLAAPAELALSEMRLQGKILDEAGANAAINQRAVFMAMTRDREQRDEFHPTKASLAGNLPHIRFDSSTGKMASSPLPGSTTQTSSNQGTSARGSGLQGTNLPSSNLLGSHSPGTGQSPTSAPYTREQVFAKLADLTKQSPLSQNKNSPLNAKSDPSDSKSTPSSGAKRAVLPRASVDPSYPQGQ